VVIILVKRRKGKLMRKGYRRLNEKQKKRIRQLYKQGLSYTKVAKKMGVSRRTVARYAKQKIK